ncbi:MAG: hypothetical protein JSR54_19800, partial [Proteobacteria bacterium]|nr:hypothetical protein [Pseudomonadota bacterium]
LEALARLEAELAAAPPAHALANRRARLYAELANVALIADQPTRTRAAAAAGLAALDDPAERPLVTALRMLEAFAILELGERAESLRRYEALAAEVPEGEPYFVCVLGELAYAHYRNDQIGAAVTELVRAYALSAAPGYEADRADTAEELATMFQRLDFTDEALPLAAEAVALTERRGDDRQLSDAVRRRGELLAARGDYAAARRDLARARELADRTRDRFRQIFAAASTCTTERLAGRFAAAERACRDAQHLATGFENPLGRIGTLVASGELDLARGRPGPALQALDTAAAVAPGAVSQVMWKRIHLARSHALEALGDYHGAYQAAQRYLEVAHSTAEAQTATRVAVLRVQFETARTARELKVASEEKELLAQKAAVDRRIRDLSLGGAALTLAAAAAYGVAVRRRRRAERARRDAEQR